MNPFKTECALMNTEAFSPCPLMMTLEISCDYDSLLNVFWSSPFLYSQYWRVRASPITNFYSFFFDSKGKIYKQFALIAAAVLKRLLDTKSYLYAIFKITFKI